MPTRRQDPETKEFRQSAFSSSPEFERGILGNLVAFRCQCLTDREEIAMLWWLQQISWREGGLERFAHEICETYEDLIPKTRRMNLVDFEEYGDPFPMVWPESLAQLFSEALVDPESPSLKSGRNGFPKLWFALCDAQKREIESARGVIVETKVTRQIYEQLDFASETRSFILIEGCEGLGKSVAAKAWCAQHPGRAVYVRLESGTDETTLYRSIAREIGTACSYRRKAIEMRGRIQDALQPGHLMLVLDESHFLMPTSSRSERTTPKRMDWLRTAVIDFGVPVAMISTPQFFERQCERFVKTGWNANQIQRRLVRTARLPDALDEADMIAVVKKYFPEAPLRLARQVAVVAGSEVGYLTIAANLRKEVDFLAPRRPGKTETELLEFALRAKCEEYGRAFPEMEKAVAMPLYPVRKAPSAEIPAPNRLTFKSQLVPA